MVELAATGNCHWAANLGSADPLRENHDGVGGGGGTWREGQTCRSSSCTFEDTGWVRESPVLWDELEGREDFLRGGGDGLGGEDDGRGSAGDGLGDEKNGRDDEGDGRGGGWDELVGGQGGGDGNDVGPRGSRDVSPLSVMTLFGSLAGIPSRCVALQSFPTMHHC